MEIEVTDSKRSYRQTARAAAAEATAVRIVASFRARLERQWFDDIRLEDVAQDAGVTAQTVIRRFGGKEGLLAGAADAMAIEIANTRRAVPGDPGGAVRALIDDYELNGDLFMRLLVQEDRYPVLRRFTDIGRAWHRAWVSEVFAPWLADLPPDQARRTVDALVVATDVYVWQLIRRDMRRPVAELRALIERLVAAILNLLLEPGHGQD